MSTGRALIMTTLSEAQRRDEILAGLEDDESPRADERRADLAEAARDALEALRPLLIDLSKHWLTLEIAIGDAYAYRLGDASGLEDEDLDEFDAIQMNRYEETRLALGMKEQ